MHLDRRPVPPNLTDLEYPATREAELTRVALSGKSRHSNDNTLAVCGWGRGGQLRCGRQKLLNLSQIDGLLPPRVTSILSLRVYMWFCGAICNIEHFSTEHIFGGQRQNLFKFSDNLEINLLIEFRIMGLVHLRIFTGLFGLSPRTVGCLIEARVCEALEAHHTTQRHVTVRAWILIESLSCQWAGFFRALLILKNTRGWHFKEKWECRILRLYRVRREIECFEARSYKKSGVPTGHISRDLKAEICPEL
ncbi:hypothetical protein J6590_032505 [Homalodisca vitripennis]|nr:hypothetical protein J6590_032505 [Homalodisca vitripennis]